MTTMLNHRTWSAMPRLVDYAQAIAHYENTTPIRGCPFKLRPAGRRDQKWFSIQKDGHGRVTLGFNWGTPANNTHSEPLITYVPTGEILIGHGRAIVASNRERILKITGIDIRRKQHRDWARASAYIEGKLVTGWFAMPTDGPAIFTSMSAPAYSPTTSTPATPPTAYTRQHVMLNTQPTYTHRLRKGAVPSIMGRMDGFLKYVEVLTRLTSNAPELPLDRQNVPKLDYKDRIAAGIPSGGLATHFWNQTDAVANRVKLFDMIENGEADPELWQNAMYWVAGWTNYFPTLYSTFLHMLREYAMAHYRDEVFEAIRADYGVIVNDRYAKFFRW